MNKSKQQLLEIHDHISKLNYGEDNFLDLINYLNESIKIAELENPDRWTNPCLNNLLQTQEKQLESMKSNFNKVDEDEREQYFNTFKNNFLSDISGHLLNFTKYPVSEQE